uniref:Uncharacterized protein n=1 Tax=Anguilla anguilla TaxID=7936 RepID=A0A0E9QNF3_ANGAN
MDEVVLEITVFAFSLCVFCILSKRISMNKTCISITNLRLGSLCF